MREDEKAVVKGSEDGDARTQARYQRGGEGHWRTGQTICHRLVPHSPPLLINGRKRQQTGTKEKSSELVMGKTKPEVVRRVPRDNSVPRDPQHPLT